MAKKNKQKTLKNGKRPTGNMAINDTRALPQREACNKCGCMYPFRNMTDWCCMALTKTECDFSPHNPVNPALVSPEMLVRYMVAKFKEQDISYHGSVTARPHTCAQQSTSAETMAAHETQHSADLRRPQATATSTKNHDHEKKQEIVDYKKLAAAVAAVDIKLEQKLKWHDGLKH